MRIDTHQCARVRFDVLKIAYVLLNQFQLREASVRSNALDSSSNALWYVVLCPEKLRCAAMRCQALECASERPDMFRCASIRPTKPRCASPSVNFEMLQCAGIQRARAP